MRSSPARRSFGIRIALMTLFALGCDSATVPDPTASTSAYLTDLPGWSEFSPIVADADSITGNGSKAPEIVNGVSYTCETTPYSISRTPDKIVTLDPDVNILWLGALLQGRGYRDGIGSMAEWPVRERAPLRISIDILGPNNSRVVENPDLASVNQAIGEMIQQATTAGHLGGSSTSYSMERTHSSKQAGIALGLSTKYFGPTISASFAAGRNASETTITAYFVQRMFTASIVLPSDPADMFSDDFTQARLDQEIARGNVGSDNLPVYVANIVYGRSLLFSFTSTASADSIRAAISASVLTDSIGLSAGRKRILETARIAVVAVGGESRNASAVIQSGELKSYFEAEPALTSARPISYTIRNLGDNSIAKVSETTEYQLKECTAVPTTGRMRIDVTPNDAAVEVVGPGGYMFPDTPPMTGDQLITELVPGGYSVRVSRAGFDPDTIDVSIAAGDALDVPVTLKATNASVYGFVVQLVPKRLELVNVSCTGESQPDLYHLITANGKTMTNRLAANSISLYQGESDGPELGDDNQWRPMVVDTIWYAGSRNKLAIQYSVMDSDQGAVFGSEPERLASGTNSWTANQFPVGTNLRITLNPAGSSCATRFYWDAAKVADVFTPGPA